MNATTSACSRALITKLFFGTAMLLGLLTLFVALAENASAGGDAKVTVNSTANIDDGDCEGPPNDTGTGNCTLHEAIDMVNAGDADIINFHPPVFSKEQPGVISLCTEEGSLPDIVRDVVIDSKDSGVVIDGGSKDDECLGGPFGPSTIGLKARATSNGLDFELNGGKNFEIVNISCGNTGIHVSGDGSFSLGTVEITGVIVDNSCSDGVYIDGTNLERGSITNSEISSNEGAGVLVDIDACDDGCELDDSVLEIRGNRIFGGVDIDGGAGAGEGSVAAPQPKPGVRVDYMGELNSKITVSVSQNEVINGSWTGVEFGFLGCGSDSGVNVHVDENLEINGETSDGVSLAINAGACFVAGAAGVVPVAEGDTSDNLEITATVNGNGDIESDSSGDGVQVNATICCEESDSSIAVEVNDNGRVTGELDGINVDALVCCGDGNAANVNVNGNDEVTGEGDDGIDIDSFAGSEFGFLAGAAGRAAGLSASRTAGRVPAASQTDLGLAGSVSPSPSPSASPSPGPEPAVVSDADDNVCTITVDGNDEIDGVGSGSSGGVAGDVGNDAHGIDADCFAGARDGGLSNSGVAGAPLSSGDANVSTINITNNNDIDGDEDGINADAIAGSMDGEADDNLTEVIVSGNGEITGDTGDGIEVDTSSGTPIEEGDDNSSVVTIEENTEIGGNGSDGINVASFAGGITDGSENDSTKVTIVQNGSIEGSGAGDDGIELDSIVCCDPTNVNTVSIINNKDEITGHDGSGIDIETCCSVNIITVSDNADNIRGGDGDGLELGICGVDSGIVLVRAGEAATAPGFSFGEYVDCLKSAVTHLTVMNNSFSDSEEDGIDIEPGVFQDEGMDIKSVISNNIIEGNGDDGIDLESATGLNIGPDNEIFLNGTDVDGNGIEVDWYTGACAWLLEDNKLAGNGNTITQNSIYDNAGLGIDLVGYDPDDSYFTDITGCFTFTDGGLQAEGIVGCVPFPETAINPNDCIPFPELQTQSGDKLIGVACSLCTVEVFWADNDPANNDDAFGVPHGEGAEYIISGEADEDGNFSIQLPCDLDPGDLTATATDKLKNTSEFAANLVTLGTGSCATDTPVPTDTPDVTDTPVPTATPVPAKVCGDVNLDSAVNSVDATLVLQFKADMISSLANESSADVNNDGAITSVDAALVLQATAGLINTDALTCG